MTPTDFPEATVTLTPPQGMSAEECGGLRIWTDGHRTISAWQPSSEEIARIQAGEPVYLWVYYGGNQPPVSLTVGSPFIAQGSYSESDANALSALGIGGRG